MIQIINQFSYPIFAILLGLALIAATKRIPRLNRIMRLSVVTVYVMVSILVGMTTQYPDSPIQVETLTDVETTLINEQPTFVMLYSNY